MGKEVAPKGQEGATSFLLLSPGRPGWGWAAVDGT